jgi:tripartite ATP-independent transporter DctM subunit
LSAIGLSFLFILFAFIGVPLFSVMGGLSLGLFHLEDVDLSAVAIEMYRMTSSPTLISIPLFTLAGYILAESKSPNRLLQLAGAVLGNRPSAVAIISLAIAAFFTAFTGASGVTIIALGGLIYPMLREKGFSESYSLGFVTTTGSLGLLFPPSLPVILYGIIARVDIDQLFLAGIVPGLLLLVILGIHSLWWSKKHGSTVNTSTISFDKELITNTANQLEELPFLKALWQARFELPLPFFVLIGIYGGYITVTEASTLTLAYVFLMVFVFYQDIPLKKLPKIIQDSMTLVGSILLILCCALGLTNYLVDEEIPMRALEFFKQYITNKYVFLLFINIFLLIVGSLMDIFSAIIVVLPLLLPLAQSFDIHPMHLAIIFLTNLEIGYITPPIGINLFISSFRFKKSILSLYKSSFPFLLLLLIGLLIITYVPYISLLFV